MKNSQQLDQLRYWRNSLADAARNEIPVNKMLAVKEASIDFAAGKLAAIQAIQLLDTIENSVTRKKG
ncbi:MAG: hypothetical protein EOO39_26750 [Cytophagaceae bacterium]|nr:MAG: hypothetical protein EOO39_26750 [Cytophagaceae bacterium]